MCSLEAFQRRYYGKITFLSNNRVISGIVSRDLFINVKIRQHYIMEAYSIPFGHKLRELGGL